MAYCIGYLYQRRKIIGVGACGGRIYWMIATGERGFPSPKRARADAAGYRTGHPKAVERLRRQAAEASVIDGILRTDEGALVTRMT